MAVSYTHLVMAGGAEADNIVKTRLASGDMADLLIYNSGALLSALNPGEYFIDISQDVYKRQVSHPESI